MKNIVTVFVLAFVLSVATNNGFAGEEKGHKVLTVQELKLRTKELKQRIIILHRELNKLRKNLGKVIRIYYKFSGKPDKIETLTHEKYYIFYKYSGIRFVLLKDYYKNKYNINYKAHALKLLLNQINGKLINFEKLKRLLIQSAEGRTNKSNSEQRVHAYKLSTSAVKDFNNFVLRNSFVREKIIQIVYNIKLKKLIRNLEENIQELQEELRNKKNKQNYFKKNLVPFITLSFGIQSVSGDAGGYAVPFTFRAGLLFKTGFSLKLGFLLGLEYLVIPGFSEADTSPDDGIMTTYLSLSLHFALRFERVWLGFGVKFSGIHSSDYNGELSNVKMYSSTAISLAGGIFLARNFYIGINMDVYLKKIMFIEKFDFGYKSHIIKPVNLGIEVGICF